MGFSPVRAGVYVSLDDDKPAARFDHPSACDQNVAACRSQKVDLHLGGQHFGPIGHHAEGRVAGCAVTDREGEPGMGIAVLLKATGQNWRMYFGLALACLAKSGAKRGHHRLGGEAGLQFFNFS